MPNDKDFIGAFQQDHYRIKNHVNSLQKSIENSQITQARTILNKIEALVESHFKFEEDFLYPRLQRLMREITLKLYNEHQVVLKFFKEATDIVKKDRLSKIEKENILNNLTKFYTILDKCEDLTYFAKKFDGADKDDLSRRLKEYKTKQPTETAV